MAPLAGKGAQVIPFPARAAAAGNDGIGDLRFRFLIGEAGWAALPETTRRRFGKRVADGTAVYAGEIVECRMNPAGWLLAHCSNLFRCASSATMRPESCLSAAYSRS